MNHLPDALSRAFDVEEEYVASFGGIKDEEYLRLLDEVQKFPLKYANWQEEDGKLYRFRNDPMLDPIVDRDECWRLVVPIEHQERVLEEAHCTPNGSFRDRKTYNRVAREYYGKGAYHDVYNFVKKCVTYQHYKVPCSGHRR